MQGTRIRLPFIFRCLVSSSLSEPPTPIRPIHFTQFTESPSSIARMERVTGIAGLWGSCVPSSISAEEIGWAPNWWQFSEGNYGYGYFWGSKWLVVTKTMAEGWGWHFHQLNSILSLSVYLFPVLHVERYFPSLCFFRGTSRALWKWILIHLRFAGVVTIILSHSLIAS